MKNLRYLSEKPNFNHGYIIIDDTLFLIDHGHVDDSWQLSAIKLKDKVAEARKVAELSKRKNIYFDNLEMYDEYTVSNEERLITAQEAYDELDEDEKEGWEDIFENINK